MKKIAAVLMTAGCILGFGGMAMAAENDSQEVTMDIQSINEITVSGSPTLDFTAANLETVGSKDVAYEVGSSRYFQITDDTSATYSVTTNSAINKKITAHLDGALTAQDLQLFITVASDSGTSAEEVEITSAVTGSATDVVTGLTQAANSNQQITYRAVASVATPVDTYAPSVTLTITD